jgi:hypothetical protein
MWSDSASSHGNRLRWNTFFSFSKTPSMYVAWLSRVGCSRFESGSLY